MFNANRSILLSLTFGLSALTLSGLAHAFDASAADGGRPHRPQPATTESSLTRAQVQAEVERARADGELPLPYRVKAPSAAPSMAADGTQQTPRLYRPAA